MDAGARSPGCLGVSLRVWPRWQRARRTHLLPREPGSRSGEQERANTRFSAPRGPTWGQSSCRAVLWRLAPRAQSFPFCPEVSILISSPHSRETGQLRSQGRGARQSGADASPAAGNQGPIVWESWAQAGT